MILFQSYMLFQYELSQSKCSRWLTSCSTGEPLYTCVSFCTNHPGTLGSIWFACLAATKALCIEKLDQTCSPNGNKYIFLYMYTHVDLLGKPLLRLRQKKSDIGWLIDNLVLLWILLMEGAVVNKDWCFKLHQTRPVSPKKFGSMPAGRQGVVYVIWSPALIPCWPSITHCWLICDYIWRRVSSCFVIPLTF